MLFEQHFKSFWRYILTFQYFWFLMNFCNFWVFVFGYKVYNENPEITESLFSGLRFDHYFNCFSMKTDINKSRLNLIYSVGSDLILRFRFNIFNVGESFWEWCRLNSISSVFEVVYLCFSILRFFINFWDFQVFVFGYRAQSKNPETTENHYI